MNLSQNKPHYLIVKTQPINKVMRLVCVVSLATEVVLLRKLGRNDVGFSGELRMDRGEFRNAEL
jgi:hypothetical protein